MRVSWNVPGYTLPLSCPYSLGWQPAGDLYCWLCQTIEDFLPSVESDQSCPLSLVLRLDVLSNDRQNVPAIGLGCIKDTGSLWLPWGLWRKIYPQLKPSPFFQGSGLVLKRILKCVLELARCSWSEFHTCDVLRPVPWTFPRITGPADLWRHSVHTRQFRGADTR